MAIAILKKKSQKFQSTVKEAPLLPGCYIYRDFAGKVLYVGKAKILRNRVRSYFSNYSRVEEKIRQMIDQAASVEFLVADSEIEALILEGNLIKKYLPKYNSMLVDDKSYAYVKFDPVKVTKPGVRQQIPSIHVVREKTRQPGATYFGPYPDSRVVKRLLRRLRKIYPYCTSKIRVEIPASRHQPFISDAKACFHYHIKLCNGACAGLATREEYEQNLKDIRRFFKGEKSQLARGIERKMVEASKAREYELAAKYRNMLNDIKYVGSNLHIDGDIDEVSVMKEKKAKRQRAQEDLITKLDFPLGPLAQPTFRIECYDISNIQGKFAVGSMVVFINGEPQPSFYRRFRIRMKNEPNDFAMMQEVLTRRFNQYLLSLATLTSQQTSTERPSTQQPEAYTDIEGFTVDIPKDLQKRMKNWTPDESFSQLPDLIIIDGGKGQLSSAYKVLDQYRLTTKVPIVGLAKKEEDIFKVSDQFSKLPRGDGDNKLPDWNNLLLRDSGAKVRGLIRQPLDVVDSFDKIHLPRRSEALYLVQRIRDEAHRFAITYHRKLRSRSFTTDAK